MHSEIWVYLTLCQNFAMKIFKIDEFYFRLTGAMVAENQYNNLYRYARHPS